MANKETVSAIVNVTLRLLIICLVVAALVALVYAITKDPIAEGDLARKEQAIRGIFAEAACFEDNGTVVGEGVEAVFTVLNGNGTVIGYCVDYMGSSDYGGDVNMMIGVNTSGRVIGVQIISHAETFIDRYTDADGRYTGIDQPYGADISAGATMSYNAIRNAMDAVEALFVEEGKEDAASQEQLAFGEADVSLFFADVADFSEQEANSDGRVKAVRLVKNAQGTLVGRCVQYTAAGGHNGDISLLMALSPTGDVIGVKVLHHYYESIDGYLDENQCFDPEQGVIAGATRSYTAVRNAIAAVEAMELGGAV